MGMFLFPFRHAQPARLLALGMALLLAGAGGYIYESRQAVELHRQATEAEACEARGETAPPELAQALEAWNQKLEFMQPSQESKEDHVAAIQGGYWSAFKHRAAMVYWMHSEFHYRFAYFDVLSMMFIGMALLKWGVFQAGLPVRVYLLMVLLGYGIGLPVNWYETATLARDNFSLVTNYRLGVTYDLGRIATVTGHIGLVMLFCRSGWLPRLRTALAAVGRLALTNYLMQTVITSTVFVGLAQFGRWERHQLYFLVLGIWVLQLVASPLWLRRYEFGPAEWVWRSLIYWRRQPLKRQHPEPTTPFRPGAITG
jgi:uncharacterized protein